MRDSNSLQEVRRHVPAQTLGIELPPGYHVLEARFRLVLCFGDTEVRGYSIGADPKQIERDAARHAARQRLTRPEALRTPSLGTVDPLTGLPWTTAASAEAAALALEYDLHAICIHLTGLDALIELQGYRASRTVLREAAQALKGLLTNHDRLARHSGDKLLIFTTRPLGDVETLVEAIHRAIVSVAVEAGEDRLPQSRIGVASLPRTEDPAESGALIEALVISAEAASTALEQQEPEGTAAPVGRQPALEAPPVPPHAERMDQVLAAKAPTSAVEIPVPTAHPEVTIGVAPAAHGPAVNGESLKNPELEQPPSVELPYPLLAAVPLPNSISLEAEAPGTPAAAVYRAEPMAIPKVETAYETPKEEVVRNAGSTKRLILKGVSLDLSGQVATVMVELVLGDRRVVGKAVGRDGEDRRLLLVAEATTRAVTDFLPRGYGVTIHHIQHAPAEVGNALWSVVFFLTPTSEQSLLGIAPADGDLTQAAANSVLNALNRRIGVLLSESN